MNEKEIKNILAKALEIGKTQKFKVKIFKPFEPMYKTIEPNYIELGIFLSQKVDNIDFIEIYLKE